MRYLLIDRIDELKKFQYAIGTKCVSLSDDSFEHHFPGQPVFPGALLIESMAQLGGALLEISLRDILPHCPRCVLSKVTAKFRDFVKPGDTLSLKAEVISRHEDSALVKVIVSCESKRVAEAEILYMLLTIDDPRLEVSRRDFLDILTRSTRYVE